MNKYFYIAEVAINGGDTLRLVKSETEKPLYEGDLVQLVTGEFGEVITVAFMSEDSPEYRLLNHIKPIEGYRVIYSPRLKGDETDAEG